MKARHQSDGFWTSLFLLFLGGGLMGFGSAPESPRVLGWDTELEAALGALRSTQSGEELYVAAMRKLGVENPWELFQRGDQSRTDAVLSREYDPETGNEVRKRRVRIFLKPGQRTQDLVMDMAHELTHAVAEAGWDPYDPDLSPSRYIRISIEGEGGEARALMNECRVGMELYRPETSSLRRCQRYLGRATESEAPRLDLQKIIDDFYRVGKWHTHLSRVLSREKDGQELLPKIRREEPMVYSSTGRAPYPVSLFKEHEEMTRTACRNSRKRVEGRTPASIPRTLVNFLRQRCASEKTESL